MRRRSLLLAAALTGASGASRPLRAAGSEIVVYTSYEKEDLAPYKAAFERDNPGVTLRWVHDANGVITARVLAEKANPRADAVWGVAASSLGLMAERGALAAYSPPGLTAIPTKFRDRSQPPRWFGNSAWVSALIFNTAEAAKANIPRPATWEDLTKEAYRGRIVMPHPVSSGTGYLYVVAWLRLFGEDRGWAYMDRLHANIWRYAHSGSQPATLAARGEAVVGMAFDIRASREKAQGGPVEIVFPAEGLGWEMNAFGVLENGPNPEAARKLADWAASETAMKLYGQTRAIAARPEFAKPVPYVPANIADLLVDMDFEWSSLNRERFLAEWTRRYESKADPRK